MGEFLNRVDACPLEAVIGPNRKIQFFDGHLQNFFLLIFLFFDHDLHVIVVVH
ncbi:hypothetical protein SDC9_211086 [bioreactor metagenome]|uniref:Uncharacterized protein n=1 Tax=bioreactor metagenome TaxID=1076179 RepID=A0A645JI05_9ZZZZ